MSFTLEEIKTVLEHTLPGVSLTIEGSTLWIQPKDISVVCRRLKEHERFSMDYLSDLTVIDYLATAPSEASPKEGSMDVVYHLCSMKHKHGPITLKVKLPRANPVIASVTPIWRGAEFQEREAYDLYGVTFEGHPDLRRILLWDEFVGHPMRKDYVVEDQNVFC